MAILIYPGGTIVARIPGNGRFFTRAEKDMMVPHHDTVIFLSDDISMLACTVKTRRSCDVNSCATERACKILGNPLPEYLYGPVLLFNNKEFESREQEKKTVMRKIEIYTDGSVINNPGGTGGTGWVIIVDDHVLKYGGTGYKSTTNNRMEMRAVLEAFEELERSGAMGDGKCDITVYSDSQIVILPLRGEWKAKSNLDLWKPLFELRDRYPVKWTWVKGHAGNPFNEMCDTLANEARENGPLNEDIGYMPKRAYELF